jgi:drug/metabolite transporter (DMT)-like permease
MYVVSAGTFDRVPPLTLGLLRLLVGIAVLFVAFRGRVGFGQAPLGRVVAAGAIVALTMALQFVGTSLTGGAEGALLTTTTPAFVLIFGVVLEKQRVGRLAWLGVAIALAGVAVLAFRGAVVVGPVDETLLALSALRIGPFDARFVGDLLLVGSAATWALFSSVGRPLVERVGAFRAILQASCVAIVLIAPFSAVELAGRELPPLEPRTVLAVLYLGVMATAVAWSLWYRGYASAPSTVSAAAFFAQPVVGAALGVAILGEALGSAFLVGGALIGAGVLAIAFGGRRRPGSAAGSAAG